MTKQPSALGYALPLIIAIAVVGAFTAWKVSSAKPSIGVSELGDAGTVAAPAKEVRWLKGQTHVHTNNGPDSIEPVDSVLAYYADAGFDFVVLTDHNHVTVANGPPGLLVIPGAEITLNRERCEPMPPGAEKCAMHMNALFVDPAKANEAFLEPPATGVFDVYKAEMQTAKQLGGVAQLNHPNYHYTGADAELLVKLSNEGLRFVEVMNEAKDLNSAGDDEHPNVETIWDQALIRGARLYAIASDDAHNYSDAAKVTSEGRNAALVNQGFIYVLAKKDPQSIRAAMEQGRFYATNGPLLDIRDTLRSPGEELTDAPEVFRIQLLGQYRDPVIKWIADGVVVGEVHRSWSDFHKDLADMRRLAETRADAGGSSTAYVTGARRAVYWRAVVEAEGKRALTQPFFVAE